MATCLGLAFWGLLLVILDININQFDLLPDFVGYVLVGLGAGGLGGVSPQFLTARNLCWLLVPMSLLGLVVGGSLGVLLGLVSIALNAIMMWFLLGGIMDVAASFGLPNLVEKASTRRKVYAVLMGAAICLIVVAQAHTGLAALGVIAVVIPMLILLVMILHLVWEVRNAVSSSSL